jgi:hypothetical protein
MAAAPDDDARRTLAELEAKLRELERELLRGHGPDDEPEPAAAAPAPAAPTFDGEPHPPTPPTPGPAAPPPAAPPTPGLHTPPAPRLDTPPAPAAPPGLDGEPGPPAPRLDPAALADAHDRLDDLRATLEDLGVTAQRITTEARAVIDDHGRTLGRLERAGEAAARAEHAAAEAGRHASTVVVEAGPFADADAVRELRDALAAQPGARDAYVRGVEDGRAVIEVHLAPPAE